ncbi:MAG: glycosyltransferase family 9 protein [Phycisphaeraceae bacterium]|nr:MAG: glycosyltransferase family 9 protein [Phycisphaeraceae bacterium]
MSHADPASSQDRSDPARPRRVLVVMPSWLGDAVMATPALRVIRRGLPGALIGVLVRPGIDQVLAGLDLYDEAHVAHWGGVMGPKVAAGKVRHGRYDAAVILANSFSTALAVRMAGIPRRIGYDRDLRGLLLTDRLAAPTRSDGRWAPIPAVRYYLELARALVGGEIDADPGFLELGCTPGDERDAEGVLGRAGVAAGTPYAVLNPGGNNEAKRWPVDRFASIGAWLRESRGLAVLINGSPGEADLCDAVAAGCGGASLPGAGVTLGALKPIVRGASIMVTNDTGPRHIAAAFGVPLVTLFGPTDHRWTTIPTRPSGPEAIVLADPTLRDDEVANDDPERSRIDRISTADVRSACERVLNLSGKPAPSAS